MVVNKFLDLREKEWEVQELHHGMIVITTKSGKEIATLFPALGGSSPKEAKANADRIVKCVNFLKENPQHNPQHENRR